MVYQQRKYKFPFDFDQHHYRRTIAGVEVVIHCHHYNARLQSIVESTRQINGKEIILSAAEEVFSHYIQTILTANSAFQNLTSLEQGQLAADLYAHLGYGSLDFSQVDFSRIDRLDDCDRPVITASHSHFVEGWQAGFPAIQRPICTFTEGYLQGVIHGLTGQVVDVREECCRMEGAPECRFLVLGDRNQSFSRTPKAPLTFLPHSPETILTSPNIDSQKIINTLVDMPFEGNHEGLMPAFNVYLANIPADFYNLVCIRFIEAMQKQNLLSTAKKLLFYAGEICALNTLRGILHSPEWEQLVEPMVKVESDRLHGLVAVTNGLAWSEWYIQHYDPPERLEMKSLRSYEALGYLGYRGYSPHPQCYMLAGLATGMMEMLHGEGTVEERLGIYHTDETACICTHHETCQFMVEVL